MIVCAVLSVEGGQSKGVADNDPAELSELRQHFYHPPRERRIPSAEDKKTKKGWNSEHRIPNAYP